MRVQGGSARPLPSTSRQRAWERIRLVDRDTVDVTNLNRQVLHWEKDTGRKKVESGREKLTGLNPHVTVEALVETHR